VCGPQTVDHAKETRKETFVKSLRLDRQIKIITGRLEGGQQKEDFHS